MPPRDSTRTSSNTCVTLPTSSSTAQIDEQPWVEYGKTEPGLHEFMSRYRNAALEVSCFEIRKDIGLSSEITFTDEQDFRQHFTSPPDKLTQIQIIQVHKLSAVGLQMIGSFFDMHLDFWAWVTSDDAADGYWLHDHNDEKVLCFDLPGIEFYQGPELPKKALLRHGRLKQLSSLHRFYGDEPSEKCLLNLFANRRVSIYLLKHNDLPVFIYFCEDCRHISSSVKLSLDPADRIVHKTFYENLQEALASDKDTYKELGEDPVILIAIIQTNIMLSWHHLAHRLQTDLEELDDKLNDSTALEAVPLYLDRDIPHMLERFVQQMEAHEGFVHHCMKRDMSSTSLYPGVGATSLFTRVERNAQILQKRLQRLIKRVGRISTARHNRLTNQQAKDSTEQGLGVSRLSLIATFFVPLSFSAAVLSMDSNRPLWIYFAVAIPCTTLTVAVLFVLNWISDNGEPGSQLFALMSKPLRAHYADENV